jgi:hypothetical protein
VESDHGEVDGDMVADSATRGERVEQSAAPNLGFS